MTRPRRHDPSRVIDLIDSSVQVIFHAVLVASVYLLFAGHNHPGGGFVGGLVAGGGIAVRYITGGIAEVRRLARFRPWTILGLGVLMSTVTAAVPLAFGNAVLESAKSDLDVPVFGSVTVSTVLPFEIGVYLAVVGLVLMVFEAFGDEYTTDPGAPPPSDPSPAASETGGQPERLV
jgi:multicomponent Na+:H+ antiporter subunit A